MASSVQTFDETAFKAALTEWETKAGAPATFGVENDKLKSLILPPITLQLYDETEGYSFLMHSRAGDFPKKDQDQRAFVYPNAALCEEVDKWNEWARELVTRFCPEDDFEWKDLLSMTASGRRGMEARLPGTDVFRLCGGKDSKAAFGFICLMGPWRFETKKKGKVESVKRGMRSECFRVQINSAVEAPAAPGAVDESSFDSMQVCAPAGM